VAGQLVYVNYGVRKTTKSWTGRGIDVRGKIVIAPVWWLMAGDQAEGRRDTGHRLHSSIPIRGTTDISKGMSIPGGHTGASSAAARIGGRHAAVIRGIRSRRSWGPQRTQNDCR